MSRLAATLASGLATLALAPAALAADCPRTTLGDIEDEVMCPICGTPLGLAQEAPQAQQQRAFIEEYGLTYPMLRDGPGDTRDDLGILGLPETFVIDRQGRVAAVQRGPVDDEFMREQVVPLLRERA